MSVLQRLIGALLRPVTKRRARGLRLADAIVRLERSTGVVEGRFAEAGDTPGNREAMNHIVGIERWGQSRLRVAAGAPLRIDSYRNYRLPGSAGVEELREAFHEARQRTLELARELEEADVDAASTVRHNDLGELTIIEWLVYLDDHAKRESLRIRR